MASLEPHPTSGHFNICLRWQGKKLRRMLKTSVKKEAEAIMHRFEENVILLERGRLVLPESGDLMTFLLSDGKPFSVHAEGERMILTRTEGERQEIDLVAPTPPHLQPLSQVERGVKAADLPTPLCPMGEVVGFGTDEANAEPPAPGTSPLDEIWPPIAEGGEA